MKEERWIIGADESGTGSLAGCFTVCAYACREADQQFLISKGIRDSKKLSDQKRRALCYDILSLPKSCAEIQVVEAKDSMPQRKAWREAVAKSVMRVVAVLGQRDYVLLIDGKEDEVLQGYFQRQWGLKAKFVVGGDDIHPTIGAASILAKTERNDRMLDLHKLYPHYGFDQHYGYGSELHFEAIAIHGVCAEHRRVKPLAAYFGEVHEEET